MIEITVKHIPKIMKSEESLGLLLDLLEKAEYELRDKINKNAEKQL